MERKVVVVCAAVGLLGLLSAALGFAAEATRVKASEVQTSAPGTCSYPYSPALGLGLGAAVALMIAQAIINIVAGCICCKRNSQPSDTNWSAALISFILSWITFIIAFLLLLTGAALNDQRGDQTMYFAAYCYIVKPGVFSGGAVLSLASVALGIVYYVALSSSKSSSPRLGGDHRRTKVSHCASRRSHHKLLNQCLCTRTLTTGSSIPDQRLLNCL